MEGYMGQFPVDQTTHPDFKDKTPVDWAKEIIVDGLLTDGVDHKQWALNQALMVLTGTPMVVEEARWENGTKEFRHWTGEPSEGYHSLLAELEAQDYSFDPGIPP